MKTVIILYLLVLLSSVAFAEIYRWEDANGVNFTDDSSSVPEQYREKFFAETNAQPENTTHTELSSRFAVDFGMQAGGQSAAFAVPATVETVGERLNCPWWKNVTR